MQINLVRVTRRGIRLVRRTSTLNGKMRTTYTYDRGGVRIGQTIKVYWEPDYPKADAVLVSVSGKVLGVGRCISVV